MKFGPLPVEDTVGALAAHNVRAGDTIVKKGSLVPATVAAFLKRAGIDTIVAVQLERSVDEAITAATFSAYKPCLN
jgi:molybdenum cofactor cytidylyltransferase